MQLQKISFSLPKFKKIRNVLIIFLKSKPVDIIKILGDETHFFMFFSAKLYEGGNDIGQN